MAILTPDKMDFRAQNITRDKENCFMMIKGSVHEEDITTLNVHAPNNSFQIQETKTNRTIGELDKPTNRDRISTPFFHNKLTEDQ